MSTSFRALLPETGGGGNSISIPMLGGSDGGAPSFQQEYDAYCKLSKKNVSQRQQPHSPA